MKWINVRDQLPNSQEHKSVLCCYKSGNVKETPTTLVEFSGYVEYWMPLPKSPSNKHNNNNGIEPIENALYATGRFLTTEATDLAEGILEYLKDSEFEIIKINPPK